MHHLLAYSQRVFMCLLLLTSTLSCAGRQTGGKQGQIPWLTALIERLKLETPQDKNCRFKSHVAIINNLESIVGKDINTVDEGERTVLEKAVDWSISRKYLKKDSLSEDTILALLRHGADIKASQTQDSIIEKLAIQFRYEALREVLELLSDKEINLLYTQQSLSLSIVWGVFCNKGLDKQEKILCIQLLKDRVLNINTLLQNGTLLASAVDHKPKFAEWLLELHVDDVISLTESLKQLTEDQKKKLLLIIRQKENKYPKLLRDLSPSSPLPNSTPPTGV